MALASSEPSGLYGVRLIFKCPRCRAFNFFMVEHGFARLMSAPCITARVRL